MLHAVQIKQSKGKAARIQQAQEAKEKAQERALKYTGRVQAIEDGQLHVEVGSLEEVLNQMETDNDGNWDSVMFIPPAGMSDMSRPAS